LTCFAGLMSGLTVGYLSIDDLVMELKMTTGTEEEKRQADLVLPILSKRHWLLVTLLLCNAGAMEALPIFLDKLMPEYLAILVSVSLVLVFGEVLPQAVCTGPDQIKIASLVAPLTKGLMYVTAPISYPIAKALDYLLGEHHKSRFLNNDLKALIELHTYNSLQKMNLGEKGDDHNHHGGGDIHHSQDENLGLNQEQANLMISAIDMKEKKAIELMIPMKNVFMIDYDEILDKFRFGLLIEKGFSRIPVYSNHDRNDIVGLLRIKQLTGIDFNQNKSLRQLGIDLKKPIVISPSLSLLDLLREFKKGKSHMAFITEQVEELQQKLGLNNRNSIDQKKLNDSSYKKVTILGIITLEDVIEKMINTEILDEDDYERIKRKFTGKKNLCKLIIKN
jgi:metal transporter CNNM